MSEVKNKKPLDQRFKNLLDQYNALVKSSQGQARQIECLNRAAHNARKAMHYAVQKEDILKQRFIKKYGVDAYIELANFTENFSFDPVKFKESNERGIKRKERIEELEQQLYQSNKERAELEEKLSHQTQIMDAMTKTSQNNYKLTQQVKDYLYTSLHQSVITSAYIKLTNEKE
jgi:hypothetical protein